MNQLIHKSKEIVERAKTDHPPFATVALVSGGNDSILMLEVLKAIDIRPDFILHVDTGTGLEPTREFVREVAQRSGIKYIEASAGMSYQDRVLKKGFFGRGIHSHSFAYHLLKKTPLRRALTQHIRQGKKNRNILLFNGVRIDESDNRKYNFGSTEITIDKDRPHNIWTNVVHWWTHAEREDFLAATGASQNPVAKELGRSGECMCGTMQGKIDRYQAAKLCPDWGKWLDNLEQLVIDNGFPWKWGEDIKKSHLMERDGQLNIFQPMCANCKAF